LATNRFKRLAQPKRLGFLLFWFCVSTL